jgi:hypothetical protein
MKRYKPRPIDTTGVRLTADLRDACERLARNTHDVWAVGRMAEGWTYGPHRDDKTREHPDLVPFDKLPESEKEVDRRTVVQTIKALIALGYRIRKTAPPRGSRAPSVSEPAAR